MAGELNNRIEKLELGLKHKDDEIRNLKLDLSEVWELASEVDCKVQTTGEKGGETRQIVETLSQMIGELREKIDTMYDKFHGENLYLKDRIKNLERQVAGLNSAVFISPDDKVIEDVGDFFDE